MRALQHVFCHWISVAFAMVVAGPVAAQGAESKTRLQEAYGDAFVNYEPYRPEVVPAASAPEPQAPAKPREVKPPQGKERVTVAWLRKHYDEIQDRALDNPTPDNVSAHLYTKRIILDKGQRFAEAVSLALRTDPVLNENNRVPYASSGSQSIQNANYRAQEAAVREMAKQGGAVVFVDSTCRFCSMQMPIIAGLQRAFGLEFIVVSLDGSRPAGYAGAVHRDNGLYGKLGLKLTPSIVFVNKPKAYSGQDPNRYLVVAQGYYAQDELVKQIAFAGHHTKLLSEGTLRDLKVWERGVASPEDLLNLELDPAKPETFKEALQPLLLKQYKGG